MRCSKVKKLISDYIDSELTNKQTEALERHLKECPGCRQTLEDFRKIAERSGKLKEMSPPEWSWMRIKARIGPQSHSTQIKLRNRWDWLQTPAFRLTAALLLVAVVTGFVMIGLRSPQNDEAFLFLDTAPQKYTIAKLDEAEEHYQKAIKALREAMVSHEKNMDPEIVKVFNKNFELIDASIEACKQVVLDNPNSIESRNYLLTVYKKKVDLMEEMISINSNGSRPRETRSTI
ncbi:MAG: zf-HC2 domain-containing protein [Candidatus Aminicenantes bacterium]|nr:zf-HC2 domain-containing protein [Candidatus Aminicenantes bacterium]